MYNNFLVEKKKKVHDREALIERRKNKWLLNYHTKVQPELVNGYTQRINSFITKVNSQLTQLEQNPSELHQYETPDFKKTKQSNPISRMSELSRKGSRIFRFKDNNDFKSFYTDEQRIERQKNKSLFLKKYGDPSMAWRSVASQSLYNPKQKNNYRLRHKQKQINPPMRYTTYVCPSLFVNRKSKSITVKRQKNRPRTESCRKQQNDYDNFVRRSTSKTNSVFGDDLAGSVISIKDESQSSDDSSRNLKKISMTFHNPVQQKKKDFDKSYFIGITNIKLNSQDPHFKKTLQNILVKVGKSRPNHRDKNLVSQTEVLSGDIN